ncbi:GtrA family protein [Pseudomonas sp. Fig-3]|uniref:GtrA family protein n=1 Tax=Pseudomonas TaxID=286 RepID=UPI0010D45639|nr:MULTISPECIES: GtrA family protein [unclassified Pseudomonas]TNB86330.1 GtrA family protein [Pseudomonas sp. Fig-3]WNZ77475.1 GtrA family protein [Pseudomonas sp. P105]VII89685.1 Phage flippase/glucose translocase (ACLAME 747) [Pseudomonas sp. FG-3G]
MKAIWKGFFSYSLIGLANTLIHWQIFFVLRVAAGLDQALSNFAAFCVAALFSSYINALYTFEARISATGYVLFLCVMGGLSYTVGYFGDRWHLHGLLTVTAFSLISLVVGFPLSRFLVFRGQHT